MKNTFRRMFPLSVLLFLGSLGSIQAQTDEYRSPEKVETWVKQTVASHPGAASSSVIATSPGERPVYLLEIGNETGSDEKTYPSIFVGANFEGTRPLATEGAIYLAELILSEPDHYDSLNWYIVPVGNPDAASRYFSEPLREDSRNDMPTNDDRDELTDEDGPDDLNGDGLITRMRVIDPDGTWIISTEDPRLMRKADPEKGEKGIYKIFSEGTDNDGDGEYNEDGAGGTSVNLNFPFLFQNFTESGGIYPGSTPESYGVMKYVFSHPDIAMIFSFGSTNFCMVPPKGGRKGEADLNRIRVTNRQARYLNLDPSRTYTMDELVKIIRSTPRGEDLEESDIARLLGLGAILNPQEDDLIFYNKYAKEFREYLKTAGVSLERFEPEAASEGSMELWGYFQVGVPVFSMDLWGIPDPAADSIKAGLGGQKNKKAEGTRRPGVLEKELAQLAFSDSSLDKRGFVEWASYDHPSLGKVEIGGFVPYISTTPPYSCVDSILSQQVPWVLKLAGELPDLHICDTKITDLGKGVFELEAWVENRAYIPFPTAMGKKNRQPAPAVIILEGDQTDLLTGYRRTPVQSVAGMSKVKLKWVIQTDGPEEIELLLESKTAGRDRKSITIGG